MSETHFKPQEIQILWQDDAFIAINKPAGLLSIPDGYRTDLPTVRTVLEPLFGTLWIVHRLDKETSGAMLLPRSVKAHKALNAQFENRLVQKIYHAVVTGIPSWDDSEVTLPLRVNGDRQHRTVVAPLTGKPASTRFHKLTPSGAFCLLEAKPSTGYTHQIRAHLSASGFPVAGDSLYKGCMEIPGKPPISIPRMLLHAFQITFTHPVSGTPLTISAPYPRDFQFIWNEILCASSNK